MRADVTLLLDESEDKDDKTFSYLRLWDTQQEEENDGEISTYVLHPVQKLYDLAADKSGLFRD